MNEQDRHDAVPASHILAAFGLVPAVPACIVAAFLITKLLHVGDDNFIAVWCISAVTCIAAFVRGWTTCSWKGRLKLSGIFTLLLILELPFVSGTSCIPSKIELASCANE